VVVVWLVNSVTAGPKCLAVKSCTRKRSWKWIQRILYLYAKVYTVLQQDIAVIAVPVWVIALYSTHHKFSPRTRHNEADMIDDNEKKFNSSWNNCTVIITYNMRFNRLAPELFFFLIFAHSVYEMWIKQEPNMLELRNKLHFEEKKRRVYTMFKIFSTYIWWINI